MSLSIFNCVTFALSIVVLIFVCNNILLIKQMPITSRLVNSFLKARILVDKSLIKDDFALLEKIETEAANAEEFPMDRNLKYRQLKLYSTVK